MIHVDDILVAVDGRAVSGLSELWLGGCFVLAMKSKSNALACCSMVNAEGTEFDKRGDDGQGTAKKGLQDGFIPERFSADLLLTCLTSGDPEVEQQPDATGVQLATKDDTNSRKQQGNTSYTDADKNIAHVNLSTLPTADNNQIDDKGDAPQPGPSNQTIEGTGSARNLQETRAADEKGEEMLGGGETEMMHESKTCRAADDKEVEESGGEADLVKGTEDSYQGRPCSGSDAMRQKEMRVEEKEEESNDDGKEEDRKEIETAEELTESHGEERLAAGQEDGRKEETPTEGIGDWSEQRELEGGASLQETEEVAAEPDVVSDHEMERVENEGVEEGREGDGCEMGALETAGDQAEGVGDAEDDKLGKQYEENETPVETAGGGGELEGSKGEKEEATQGDKEGLLQLPEETLAAEALSDTKVERSCSVCTGADDPLKVDGTPSKQIAGAVKERELEGIATPRAVSKLNRRDLQELKTFRVPSSPRMLRIHGSRFPCVSRVPCSSSMLATNGVSVVWCPSGRIFVWHGASSSAQERVKALEIASALKDMEHRSRGTIQRVEEGDEEDDFWELVGGPDGRGTAQGLPDEASYWSAMEVLGWKEEERCVVNERPLRQQILRSESVFIIASSFVGVFVWIGRDSSQAAAEAARQEAEAMAARMRGGMKDGGSEGVGGSEGGDGGGKKQAGGVEAENKAEEEARKVGGDRTVEQGRAGQGQADGRKEEDMEGVGGNETDNEGQRENEEDKTNGGGKTDVEAGGGDETFFEVETVLEGWEHSIFKSLFVDWLTPCGTSSKLQAAVSSPIVDGILLGRQAKATMTPTSKGSRRRSDAHVGLVCVQGRRFITARSVEPVAALVNDRDIFILDGGRCVYQRNGRNSSPQAKAKAAEICLAYVQMHAGKALHVVLDPDDDKEQKGDSMEFWNLLGGRGGDQPSGEEEGAPEESEIKARIKLWRVGEGGEEVQEVPRPYRQSCLSSDGAFVLSWEEEQLFVWTGNAASTRTKQRAFDWAAELQREAERQEKRVIAVEAAVQYGEPPLFRSHFIGWIADRPSDRSRPDEKSSYEPGGVRPDSSKILERRAAELDLEAMEGSAGATLPLITPAVKHDDGSTGSCRVWIVEQGKLKEMEMEEGENKVCRPLVLDSRHCYVMRYTYCPGIDRTQTRSITYVWQGRWAGRATMAAAVMSMGEVSSASTSGFVDDKEVVEEGKESQHFAIAMGKALVITPAELREESGGGSSTSRLFMVCDFGDAPTSGAAVGLAVEVRPKEESFYSGACYFLIAPKDKVEEEVGAGKDGPSAAVRVFVWKGGIAREPMRALAETCARAVVKSEVLVEQVEEGKEPKELLDCLAVERLSQYARVDGGADGGRDESFMGITRLFHFELAGTMVRPREVARPSAQVM
eukprot:747436-Hanusia_phi.AAC.1